MISNAITLPADIGVSVDVDLTNPEKPVYGKAVIVDNRDLLHWAKRPQNRPPQSWYDDKTDPFKKVDK